MEENMAEYITSKFRTPEGDTLVVKDSEAREGLANKVDKVSGKGLSTNDYTTTEKNKLAGISSGAEANVQSDWSVTDTASDAFIKNKPTIPTVPSASSTTPKMDGTAAVGTGTTWARADHVHPSDTSKVSTSTTVNGHALTGNVTVTASDIGVASGAEVNQNAFSNVKVGTTTVAADTKTDTLELAAGDNVTITPDATNDKITIAATDTTYSSLAAASGGTAVSLVTTGEKYTWNSKTSNTGTITSVKTTAGAHTAINVTSGAANFNVPTKTSHLTNDSGFITTSDIPEGAAASTTTPKMDGTAAVGTETAFARGDHIHPTDTSRVPTTRTVNGHALSSNVTVTASDVGLGNVEDGAEVNVLEGVKMDGTDLTITNKKVNIPVFTNSASNVDGATGLVPAPVKPSQPTDVIQVLTPTSYWQTLVLTSTAYTDGYNSGKRSIDLLFKDPGATSTRSTLSVVVPNADTTNPGFMSSADKTKLDSITMTNGVIDASVLPSHTTSIATSTGTNQITLAHGSKYAITAGGTSYVFTMPSVPTASTSAAGIVQLTNSTSSTSTTTAATPSSVKSAYDLAAAAVPNTRTVNSKALSSNITLSASDVGAVPNSYGSITGVFPQGFMGDSSIKVGISGYVKATEEATSDTLYLFGARKIAPVLYDDTNNTTIWTGYTNLNPPPASVVTTGTFPGRVIAAADTSYTTAQIRNIILSTSAPGSTTAVNGTVWIQYQA